MAYIFFMSEAKGRRQSRQEGKCKSVASLQQKLGLPMPADIYLSRMPSAVAILLPLFLE
jgi:hypothetical protein